MLAPLSAEAQAPFETRRLFDNLVESLSGNACLAFVSYLFAPLRSLRQRQKWLRGECGSTSSQSMGPCHRLRSSGHALNPEPRARVPSPSPGTPTANPANHPPTSNALG